MILLEYKNNTPQCGVSETKVLTMKRLLYISLFAMLLLFAGCGSDEWTGESLENSESSEEYGEFEPQYRAYLKQWDRVIERDEFDVKLYKPYEYVVSTIVDPHLDYDRIVVPIDPSSYLPNAEWYNNAQKAIAFLRGYNLEFAVPPEGGLSYTDFAREGVPESLVLNFFSGGDRENIPELDLMINPDGTVIIRDRDGAEILRSKTKIDFKRFTELDFKHGTLMTIQQSKYMFLVDAWTRVIEQDEFDVKLYNPYRLYIERLNSAANFPDFYTPTQEWYDNAEKAISFLSRYSLDFEPNSYLSSTIYGASYDTLVLNFYSGGDKENIPELRVKIDPSGIVVIEGENANGEHMELYSKTRVDFNSFASLYSDESVYLTYSMRVNAVESAWYRVIYQHEFDAKLYDPHTLQSEMIQSAPIGSLMPTQEWYDNAQKAIEFLGAYHLNFKVIHTDSSVDPISMEAVVLNFYSGGDKENISELRVIIEPDGRVIIEDIRDGGGIFRMESLAKVDFERFSKLFNISD